MQLESFSGLSVTAVKQDFYATVFMANLHAILIKDAQRTTDATCSRRKYRMKINKNKSFGKLKNSFVCLFLTQQPAIILQLLHDFFRKELIPIEMAEPLKEKEKTRNPKANLKPTQTLNQLINPLT